MERDVILSISFRGQSGKRCVQLHESELKTLEIAGVANFMNAMMLANGKINFDEATKLLAADYELSCAYMFGPVAVA